MKEGVEEIEKSQLQKQITCKLLKDFQLTLNEFIIKGRQSVSPNEFLELWQFIDNAGLNRATEIEIELEEQLSPEIIWEDSRKEVPEQVLAKSKLILELLFNFCENEDDGKINIKRF